MAVSIVWASKWSYQPCMHDARIMRAGQKRPFHFPQIEIRSENGGTILNV